MYRDLGKLRVPGGDSQSSNVRHLRSGVVAAPTWAGADKRDLGDNIATLAEDFRNDKSSREKYKRKKSRPGTSKFGPSGNIGNHKNTRNSENLDDSSEFNPEKIKKWVKIHNAIVQKHARNRALGADLIALD